MSNRDELMAECIREGERVKTDSRSVAEGDIFIAIKGPNYDGHDFIPEVIKKGAGLVVLERPVAGQDENGASRVKFVDSTRDFLGDFARIFYGDPSSHLNMYGVTGTNGKTTTAFLMEKILANSGRRCGLVSTVYTGTGGEYVRSESTTPGVIELNRLLKEMVDRALDSASVEISSHALDQKRLSGIKLDAVVFTNITQEHLDYHVTIENYLEAKLKVFDLLKPSGTGIINVDDARLREAIPRLKGINILTFGIENKADITAKDIKTTFHGTEIKLDAGHFGAAKIRTSLIGRHNVYNILGVVGALRGSGISLEKIKEGVEKFESVPGRLEEVKSKAPFSIFVDYAHTPDALEKVLLSLKGVSRKKIICVFGCGGNRDRSKRPVMGGISARMCDMVFLTSDNPRGEDPMTILSEIEKGMPKGCNYSIISDRYKAILQAVRSAGEKDIILIAGKGHEDYQIIGAKRTFFDDREAARRALKETGYEV